MTDFRGSARGSREVDEIIKNPEIFKNIPVLAPAGRPAPGPGRDLFWSSCAPLFTLRKLIFWGPKNPCFWGVIETILTQFLGPKMQEYTGFPGVPGPKISVVHGPHK